MKHMVVTGWF